MGSFRAKLDVSVLKKNEKTGSSEERVMTSDKMCGQTAIPLQHASHSHTRVVVTRWHSCSVSCQVFIKHDTAECIQSR